MVEMAWSGDGNRLYYDAYGEGPVAIVFVHGWSCDRTYWKRQTDYFAERYQVVAIDLAGHGESDGQREAWPMSAFGEDVVAVVEKLALEKVVLVGHSMGGDVIVDAALSLGDRVAGLFWIDTYNALGRSRSAEELARYADRFRDDFVAATRNMVRRMFPAGANPDLVEWVAADMSSAPAGIAVEAMEHAMSNQEAVVTALKLLTAPVIAINPDYRPNDVASLERHGVRTVVMTGVGHFLMMEDPEAFNLLLAGEIEGLIG
jgi:pimeloyl-ACP methyl ester carboxylesterase